MLTDTQEESLHVMDSLLNGQDLAAGNTDGQVNNPGVYRSVCLEIDLRTKMCVAALQHARYLRDMEGGELSKKLIRKVPGADKGDPMRNVDHSSEASVTSLESLVNMVQAIAAARGSKADEIKTLRQRWAAQSGGAVADVPEDDDEKFIAVMRDAGLDNSVLSERLEEFRAEYDTYCSLLDGLYSWLASPTSLFFRCSYAPEGPPVHGEGLEAVCQRAQSQWLPGDSCVMEPRTLFNWQAAGDSGRAELLGCPYRRHQVIQGAGSLELD
jgi:hypothetical protein